MEMQEKILVDEKQSIRKEMKIRKEILTNNKRKSPDNGGSMCLLSVM